MQSAHASLEAGFRHKATGRLEGRDGVIKPQLTRYIPPTIVDPKIQRPSHAFYTRNVCEGSDALLGLIKNAPVTGYFTAAASVTCLHNVHRDVSAVLAGPPSLPTA